MNSIAYDRLTHINYSFVLPTWNGGLTSLDDPGRLYWLVDRAHAAGVKVQIAIGGWNDGDDSPFRVMAADAGFRNNFIQNVLNFVNQFQLDGVDIDWEYPSGEEIPGYKSLIWDLGWQLHQRGKILTAAVTANDFPGTISTDLLESFDFLNVMAYDLGTPHSSYSAARDSIYYWRYDEAVPQDKIVLGVPFYGRAKGYAAYKDIVSANGSWASQSDSAGGQDYNGQPTIRAKAQVAREVGGGIMIWEISQDTEDDTSLLKAIWEVVGNDVKK